MAPPKPMPIIEASDITRFWSNVDRQQPGQCWPWKMGRFTDGYGQTRISRRNMRAHRVAYYLHYGVDPGNNLVCHACDNPICCNPYHLFLGDEAANAQDCVAKGRTNTASGERHGSRTKPESRARGERIANARLTADGVRDIRTRYAEGGLTCEALAAEYGVTREAISRVIQGKNWKHVEMPPDGALRAASDRNRITRSSRVLTEEQVRTIRETYAAGGVGYRKLATQYGVTSAAIRCIVKRTTWQHLD